MLDVQTSSLTFIRESLIQNCCPPSRKLVILAGHGQQWQGRGLGLTASPGDPKDLAPGTLRIYRAHHQRMCEESYFVVT